MRTALFLFTIASLSISSCSEKQPELTQNERNYLATQDSLIKYKSLVLEFSDKDSTNQSISDYMKLNYQSYRTKYQLSEKEMDLTRRVFDTRCEIAKTFRAIRQNGSRSNSIDFDSKDSTKGSYSFDQRKVSANKNDEVEIVMKAFEEKKNQ